MTELILLLQTAIKNNKMCDEKDGEKYRQIVKSRYNAGEQKTDFQKTENEIVQSIINNENFPSQKRENDYIPPQPKIADVIEKETEQNNVDYLQTALEFNKVDLTTAKEY